MRKLSINTKEDLIKLKKTFKEEYKDFFKQDLKKSKVEAFLSKMAGVKNFNTLLNELPTSNYTKWEDLENSLYNGELPESYKIELLKKYFPKNFEISVSEHFDGITFNINRISLIEGNEVPDHEDSQALKRHISNMGYISDFDCTMSYFLGTNEFEQFDSNGWTETIKDLYNQFKFLNLSNKDTLLFVLDFCVFCNEGLIPDSTVSLINDYLDINIEYS